MSKLVIGKIVSNPISLLKLGVRGWWGSRGWHRLFLFPCFLFWSCLGIIYPLLFGIHNNPSSEHTVVSFLLLWCKATPCSFMSNCFSFQGYGLITWQFDLKLMQPKWTVVLPNMFQNEYIDTAPYMSCLPFSLSPQTLYKRSIFGPLIPWLARIF